jgi:chaperonin cofactor prefoldin
MTTDSSALPPTDSATDTEPLLHADAPAENSDSNSKNTGAEHPGVDVVDGPTEEETAQLQDLKSTILDSAELATRGASLAAKAGAEMHQAAQKLLESTSIQQKLNKIILAVFGVTMFLSIIVFAIMAFRISDRVGQLDAMVLAVGKRVVSMDASIEQISTASDQLKDVALKQDAISSAQSKLEARIDEAIKASQVGPDLKAKEADEQSKNLIKLVQGLEGKIQAQANSTKAISGQIQKLQSALPEAGSFRREVESAIRLLRERQVQESAATVPARPVVKPRERIVQFPRAPLPGETADKP